MKLIKKFIHILIILSSWFWCTGALAADYFVSANGDDQWTGLLLQPNKQRTDGPFKTIHRAKQAIRQLKQAGAFREKVTVHLAAGTYYLDQPLNFNLLDSGVTDKEILWLGESGAQVILSGGMPLACGQRDNVFWACSLPRSPAKTEYFDPSRMKGDAPNFQLYINGRKLQLARWPDQEWAHIKVPVDQKSQFSVMEVLPPVLKGSLNGAQVHIFAGNDWYDQYIGVDSINLQSNSIKLESPAGYALASGRRFYIRNLPALLDAPGEWLYDSASKKISFIPPAGITPSEVMLTFSPHILAADEVSYVTFKNISLQYSTGNAISLKNCTNMVMDRLHISNIGGKGVEIKNGRNVELLNSTIHHTGAGGIDVSGGDRKTLESSGHRIHNNHIHHISQEILTLTPGIHLSGVGTKVTHNLLEQGAGIGILITGNEHLIGKNELHHFCLQSSDCGAVYSGRDWSWRGNIIRNNYIHDIIGYGMIKVDAMNNRVVYASPDGARGVYLDDGASGFEVSGNIFVNAGFIALQIGGGRDNRIHNNYFDTNDYAIWVDDRWPTYDWSQNKKNLFASPYLNVLWKKKYPELHSEMHNETWPEGNTVQRNIVVTNKPNGLSLRYFVPKGTTTIADNLVWSTTGKLTVDFNVLESNKRTDGASWSQWIEQGIEKRIVVADPCARINKGNLTFCSDSPSNTIGFKPLCTNIGLIEQLIR